MRSLTYVIESSLLWIGRGGIGEGLDYAISKYDK